MNTREAPYGGWDRCIFLTNEQIELVITADVGPRVISLRHLDHANMLYQDEAHVGLTGGDEWRAYGGHRLWHSPETFQRTYQPDNQPVDYYRDSGRHVFTPPFETQTGIQKELVIWFEADSDRVVLEHRLTNRGLWDVRLAPWALTMMAPGGVGILPLPPQVSHESHLLPTFNVTFWGYDRLNDSRFHPEATALLLRQDPAITTPFKIGLGLTPEFRRDGSWLAYVRDEVLFVKSFEPSMNDDDSYPDLNSQVEIFVNSYFMELETLAPLQTLKPGATVRHREFWSLHPGIAAPDSEEALRNTILPLVRETHLAANRR